MRLRTIALILLTITTALPADDDLAQDGVQDLTEDVADNGVDAEDNDADVARRIFLIGLVVVPITIVIVITQVKRAAARRRIRSLEGAVNELGLTVQPEGNPTLQEELSPFPLFNLGRHRELRNLIVSETPEVGLSIFDYKYVTGHGKDKRDRWQTVVAIRSPDLQSPTFHLYPEGFFSKVSSAFGGQNIDFDDHPQFSNAFVLKSESEAQIRDFFDQTLLDFFSQRPDIAFEARPGTALYFRRRERIEPTALALRKVMEEGLQAFHAVRNRAIE